jgi:LacI family transcriptional regulator
MTIYDIARCCNVSIATVSRVLNDSSKVSNKTRDKVLAMMREQNYTPNAFARGLGLNSMKMVGILCTDVSDTFFAKAVSLVERDLRTRGFDVLLACTGNELEDKKKYLQLLLEKRVDAIILIGSPFSELDDHAYIEETAKQIPIIIINGLVDHQNIYCVLCDEKKAMIKNVELLHKQGYDKILYLYDALTFGGQQKLLGYKQGLKKHKLPEDTQLFYRISKTTEAAMQKTTELLQGGIKFSAAIAAEDLLAVGIQKATIKAGLNIPVIGFNNSILAKCTTPELTSVDNRLDILCPTAVNKLIDILAGKKVPQKTIISPKIIERESFKLLHK